MAAGTVLSRKWQANVSPLTFTAWQLTAGGLILLPIALFFEPALPALSATNLAGLAWLGLIGAALTYWLWFRGVCTAGAGRGLHAGHDAVRSRPWLWVGSGWGSRSRAFNLPVLRL